MGPKSQSHPTGHTLFSFLFLFFLSSPLLFLSPFFFICSSFCSSLEQKVHTHRPLTRTAFSFCFLPIQCSFCSFFFVLLPPVTHTPTHAHPSREIIGVDLRSHAEKLHHALILLIAAIVLILRFGRSVEISIHNNDLARASNRHPQQQFDLKALLLGPGTTLLEACF